MAALSNPQKNTCAYNKNIIINLIKQDLINWRMIYLLQKMQIRADDYQLDIGPIIFEMMDLENRNDANEIFDKYVEMSKSILNTKASQSNRRIDLLASKIYDYLESLGQ
jgi:hypothetical protein